jgi:hypothetical protein
MSRPSAKIIKPVRERTDFRTLFSNSSYVFRTWKRFNTARVAVLRCCCVSHKISLIVRFLLGSLVGVAAHFSLKVIHFSQTFLTTNKTTRYHNPEDHKRNLVSILTHLGVCVHSATRLHSVMLSGFGTIGRVFNCNCEALFRT